MVVSLLFPLFVSAKAAHPLMATWTKNDIECTSGELTALGRESRAAVHDGRIAYSMTFKKDKAVTRVDVWADRKKKSDYCTLETTADWRAGAAADEVIASKTKTVCKPHGGNACQGSYEHPEERVMKYVITGNVLRLTLMESGREMVTDDKPGEGFCAEGFPVLIFMNEAPSGPFKPI